jgi:hypothetical protein
VEKSGLVTDIRPLRGATFRLEDSGHSSDSGGLPVGRPLSARVIEFKGEGRWTLDLDGRRVTVQAGMALSPGDRLELIASRHESVVELRVLQVAARLDDVQYAAALLAEAGARNQAVPAWPSAARLIDLLRAMASRPGADRATATVASQLAELTLPLDAALDAGPIADGLRRHVEDGGLLLESRLRAWMEDRGGTASRSGGSAPHLPANVQKDLRALLGIARRVLGFDDPAAAAPAQSAGPDHNLQPDAPHRAEQQMLADRALARQVDLAYQWLRWGILHVEVPVRMGHHVVTADLRIGGDDQTETVEGIRPLSFDVRVDLPELGRLEAWVQWARHDLSARLFVERPDVEVLARQELGSLEEGWRRAGFGRVSVQITVDPVRLSGPPQARETPAMPGGSIFNARV